MNRPAVVLAVTTAALTVISGVLWMQLRAERQRTAVLQAQVDTMSQPALRTEPPAPLPGGSSNAPMPTLEATPTSEAGTEDDGSLLWQQLRNPDPEFRAALKALRRSRMRQVQYADLPAVLKISREQAERLYDLLAEQIVRGQEGNPFPYELDPTRQAEWRAQEEQLKQQDEAELVALLGQRKYEAFVEYQSTLRSRAEVRELRIQLSGTPDAIRDEQGPQLVSVLGELEKKYDSRQGELIAQQDTEGLQDLSVQHDLAKIEAVAPILSAAQLAIFREPIEREAELRRVQRRLQEQMKNNAR